MTSWINIFVKIFCWILTFSAIRYWSNITHFIQTSVVRFSPRLILMELARGVKSSGYETLEFQISNVWNQTLKAAIMLPRQYWQNTRSVNQSTWWRQQMEIFPRYWPFVRGIKRYSYKGQWRETLVLSLICFWTNGLSNNRDACDLGRHRAHHDITMTSTNVFVCFVLHSGFRIVYSNVQCPISC